MTDKYRMLKNRSVPLGSCKGWIGMDNRRSEYCIILTILYYSDLISLAMKVDQTTFILQLLKCIDLHCCRQNVYKCIVTVYQPKISCSNLISSLNPGICKPFQGWRLVSIDWITWVKRGTREKGNDLMAMSGHEIEWTRCLLLEIKLVSNPVSW